MKKYHIILLLIVFSNVYPWLFLRNVEDTRYSSPKHQAQYYVQVEGNRLEVEHIVYVSEHLYQLMRAPATTLSLVAFLYVIIIVQHIKKRLNKGEPAAGGYR